MRLPIMTAMAVFASLVMANTAMAQTDREPVTDPATLEALGYAPDAQNIFRLKADADHGHLKYQHDDGQSASLSFDPFPAGYARHTTASGFAFFPLTHTNEYAKGPSFLIMNGGLASITAGGIYETQWNLADGSKILILDTFGYHNETSRALTVTLVERCLDFLGSGNPVETVLLSRDIAATGGNFVDAAALPPHIADARRCSYHSRVRFSEASAPSPGLDMQLTKLRLVWIPDRIFVDGFDTPEATPISGY